MQTKTIFKSKTALAAALTAVVGALGTWNEPATAFLASHAGAILMTVAAINVALRFITKGRVTLTGS